MLDAMQRGRVEDIAVLQWLEEWGDACLNHYKIKLSETSTLRWYRRRLWLHCLSAAYKSHASPTAVPCFGSSVLAACKQATDDDANVGMLLLDRRLVQARGLRVSSCISGSVTAFLSNCCESRKTCQTGGDVE